MLGAAKAGLLGAAGNGGGGTAWNPSDASNISFSNDDLTVASTSSSSGYGVRTIASLAGKQYWEVSVDALDTVNTNRFAAGIFESTTPWDSFNNYAWRDQNSVQQSGVVATPGAYTTSDILMFAYDATANKLWFGKNGTWSGDPGAGTGGNPTASATYYPVLVGFGDQSQATGRFSPGDWSYSSPSGFTAVT